MVVLFYMKLDLRLKKLKRDFYYFHISEYSTGVYLVLIVGIIVMFMNLLFEQL